MTLNRRTFLQTSAGLPWLPHTIQADPLSSNKRPNVVLIMADDLGYETLSCNGSASYQTPKLDHLAQTGIRFTRCHVNPLCTPTRASIMTGRYNYRHYYSFGHLHQNEITFAHMLKNAGYTTAAVGKWQLGNGSQHDQSPAQAGFDEYCLWNLQLGDDYARNERYADANLIYHNRETGAPEFKQFVGEYGPDICKEYLFGFMENAVSARQPFFAYYPMILTHDPFVPTPDSPEWKRGDRLQKDKRYFKDMVETMDRIVGDIADKLDTLGIAEETMLIFLGDNGTHPSIQSEMQDGSLVTGGKRMLDHTGTHVPLIVHAPGTIPPGQVDHDWISVVDFMPTIADYTGVSLPEPTEGGIDGISFYDRCLGQSQSSRDWILIEYFEDRQGNRDEGRYIRNDRWKLYDSGTSPLSEKPFYKSGMFFDLQNDPAEEHPLDPESLSKDASFHYQKFLRLFQLHSL